ncbi:hypothetical protein [Camelimonas lactis]|uniref:Uncharacterized protein n=1 Tax=Camelimonas lactis TaxID=659006 RepID=A0A4R2GTV7_9HYPH|nr:hypothetical protein [Camelimonas lactis]TCO14069.1 hypothetical protein EV666_10419 [Camelimonas lactis]
MKPKKPFRTPTLTHDPDGQAVYIVPLSGTQYAAHILAEDWEDLQRRGYSPNWCFTTGSVHSRRLHMTAKDMPERISRVLLGVTDSRTYVRFRDRNPLNLRRDNLYTLKLKTAEERDMEMSARRRQRLNGWASPSARGRTSSYRQTSGYGRTGEWGKAPSGAR